MCFQIHMRCAAGPGYYYFHLLIYVSVGLYGAFRQQGEDTDLKFGTHSPRPYLKTTFLFFRKSDPEGHEPRKTAV